MRLLIGWRKLKGARGWFLTYCAIVFQKGNLVIQFCMYVDQCGLPIDSYIFSKKNGIQDYYRNCCTLYMYVLSCTNACKTHNANAKRRRIVGAVFVDTIHVYIYTLNLAKK